MPFAGHNLPLDSLPDPQPLTAVPLYPNLTLASPTSVAFAPDGSGLALATEQIGRVRVLPSDPNATSAAVFLDLTGDVIYTGGEQGLLSVVFDPQYASNHYLYVDYISPMAQCGGGNYCTKVVRYTRSASNPNQADPASRKPILEIPRNAVVHNGGMLQFGPDGMLYISSGDDGTSNGQDLSVLRGVILRIDPNSGNPYAIPPGNPFVGQSGKRAEIWDYGLRNPWRFTFDRITGDLWIGDVGQNSWEEVDFVPAGDPGGRNFGWAYCEGTHNFPPNQCNAISSTLPVLEYPHDDATGGFAVTGGYVYRGDLLPELYGAYIYGDYVNGKIWAYNPSSHASTQIATATSPSSFAEDPLGELVIVSLSGGLYRLQPTQGSGTQQFPTTLSATGLFSNTSALTPAAGLVEYDVISPLWSDGALKRRWIALPAGQTIGFSPDDPWSFPVGTAFVKHFELQVTPTSRRRIETRVLLRQVDRWVGYTYRWNSAQTDATLLTAALNEPFTIDSGSGSTQQTWHYPSPSECLGCHTSASGRVLGVRTRQLNRAFSYAGGSDNELHALSACMSLFAKPIEAPSFYPAIADPNNAAETIGARARSYLATNCAHCHQPGGPAPGGMNLRYEPLLGGMNLIGVTPTSGDLGIAGAQRIKVGSSAQSVLWQRVASIDPTLRMAKGSQIPDPLAVSLLRTWIDSGLATLDSDGDSAADSADNCPYEPNPTQSDGGRWLSTTPDGIGDACQCANLDSIGAVTSLDYGSLRQYLTQVPATGTDRRLSYLEVNGRGSILDVAHFKRALMSLEPPPQQICGAATRLMP